MRSPTRLWGAVMSGWSPRSQSTMPLENRRAGFLSSCLKGKKLALFANQRDYHFRPSAQKWTALSLGFSA